MMKKTIFLIVPIFVLFSFNAFSQIELKINNISRNQVVSGNLIATLDTTNIRSYKFVSYFMGDQFLSTIYDVPFTIQFDTRDFDSGKNEFSARAMRVDGITETDKVEINISNQKPAFNLMVNNVRRFAIAEQVPIDGS